MLVSMENLYGLIVMGDWGNPRYLLSQVLIVVSLVLVATMYNVSNNRESKPLLFLLNGLGNISSSLSFILLGVFPPAMTNGINAARDFINRYLAKRALRQGRMVDSKTSLKVVIVFLILIGFGAIISFHGNWFISIWSYLAASFMTFMMYRNTVSDSDANANLFRGGGFILYSVWIAANFLIGSLFGVIYSTFFAFSSLRALIIKKKPQSGTSNLEDAISFLQRKLLPIGRA